jgi:Protein of unknown function (DUF1588)/Protein of unknown function (DUF1592)/Protein of unknown function (DUF1585)/Protein of unknown function (DUF1595)
MTEIRNPARALPAFMTRARPWLLGGLACGAVACVGSIEGQRPAGTAPGGTSAPGEKNRPSNMNPATGPAPSDPRPMPERPGDQPPAAGMCAPGPGRVWPLTPAQYVRTLRALLPTAAAGVGDALGATIAEGTGFSNEASRLGFTEPHVGELLNTAYTLANKATGDVAQLAPCLASKPDDACLRGFATDFATRAFRRELASEEGDALFAFLKKEATGDVTGGLRRFLVYVFTSPNFVFRTELGDGASGGNSAGTVALSGFERGQALSYFITDGPPDPEFFAAAKAGKLSDSRTIETETKRLLAKAEGATGFSKLFREHFVTAEVKTVDKDTTVFPDWKDAFGAELAKEGDAFIDEVLWKGDAKFATLLTADFSMVNGALAGLYGVAAPAGTGFARVSHKPGERAGIVTQAARMAALATNNDTAPVGRGRFVREVLLCQAIPPPPNDVVAVPPPPDGKTPQKARLAQHSADPSCSGCHNQMDPLGLAFENYDGIGKYRKTDVGQTIDASGRLTGAEPEGASFANAVELMQLLSTSPTAHRCFVETAFRYAYGREPGAGDRCTIDRLLKRFGESGGNVIDLAVAITTDETFFVRQAR